MLVAPPPLLPARLPGDLWGITAYFNPMGYRSRLANYSRFRLGLAREGIPLATAELAIGDAPFELRPGDADLLVQLRASQVLWHKERLLNLVTRALPPSCDKVVWLDCDILFETQGWSARAADALESYVVVQPFSETVRLREGEYSAPKDLETLPRGPADNETLHGMAAGIARSGYAALGRYLAAGHSGYAWATRRSLLERHGLYDANILGNGDMNMAHAMYGPQYIRAERLSPKARRHLLFWASGFHEAVRGSVSFVEGWVLHLWHGDKSDRRYERRLSLLRDADYDPERDLVTEPSGVYALSAEMQALQSWSLAYFSSRREDGRSHPGAAASEGTGS